MNLRENIVNSVLEDMKYGPRRLAEGFDKCFLAKSHQGKYYKLELRITGKLIHQQNCYYYTGRIIDLDLEETKKFEDAMVVVLDSGKTKRICAGCGGLADATSGYHHDCNKCIYCGSNH